jgi:hypothetical protein
MGKDFPPAGIRGLQTPTSLIFLIFSAVRYPAPHLWVEYFLLEAGCRFHFFTAAQ